MGRLNKYTYNLEATMARIAVVPQSVWEPDIKGIQGRKSSIYHNKINAEVIKNIEDRVNEYKPDDKGKLEIALRILVMN